jgi:ABC-type dipeptide/oligopeptide/nickel transport system permease component
VIRYIARRLMQSILVIFGVTIVSFSVLYLSGDPTYLLLGDARGMTEEQIDAFRRQMGFDRPILVQYLDYMSSAVQGDLGRSYYHGVTNVSLIRHYMPATIQLGLTAIFISVIVGIPAGILAATYRGRLADHLTMLGALVGQAMPVFWLGLLLMLLFAVQLRWFPVSGRGTWRHLVLPAVTLASYSIAVNARMMRSSMLEVLGQDYIRTARAKGLIEWIVVTRHALKNAMIPVITMIGMQVGFVLGGSVITETIFAWPGLGRLVIQAINTRDIPLVQAIVIVFAVTFVGVNLLVDLTYAYFDPRIRLSGKGTGS